MKYEEQQGFMLLAEGSCEQSRFFFCKMFERVITVLLGFHFCTWCSLYIGFLSVLIGWSVFQTV